MEASLFEIFNFDIVLATQISAVVYVLVEGIKGKFAGIDGLIWKSLYSNILALLISVVVCTYILYPSWDKIVISALFSWLAPAGLDNLVSTKLKSGNSFFGGSKTGKTIN